MLEFECLSLGSNPGHKVTEKGPTSNHSTPWAGPYLELPYQRVRCVAAIRRNKYPYIEEIICPVVSIIRRDAVLQDVPGCSGQQAEYKGERPALLVKQGALYLFLQSLPLANLKGLGHLCMVTAASIRAA